MKMDLPNRIYFPGNPWPNGHAIKEFRWSATLRPASGLWFDLHLESADYYAEDPEPRSDVWDQEDENKDGWESKILWYNFHACTLSSTFWDGTGFLVGTPDHPWDFATLGGREFLVDLPPVNLEGPRPFDIYLLGHDSVADHRIEFQQSEANAFNIRWRGKIAETYYFGTDGATFDRDFRALVTDVSFDGIRVSEDTPESVARRLLQATLKDADDYAYFVNDEAGAGFRKPG